MPVPTTDLPVAAILEPLSRALDDRGIAVLVAPPGAGKTTLVPLALLDRPWRRDGRILLLEPRRLAARAAARRMASLIGEEAGATVGYATRLESRSGPSTRILVVTEGVLARMILDDPELPGVAAIVFDEFHERSLDGDFGLALALDVRSALRSDLRLLVMSATLDGARVAGLLGEAPVVESHGRSFAVDIRHRDRPAGERIEDTMAAALREVVASEPGSVLAFLPGRGEIERTMERLSGRLPADVDLVPLHGDLEGAAQDAAIRPAPAGRRKIVLATSIAESSVTIDGVRVVVDSGLARVPRYEPATGLTSLETVRVSRASADQRAGRAGRTAPGVAIRLWHQGQTASLAPFSTPEIREADLSGLVLDCAAFGVSDPASLAFLDPPPEPAIAEARALLRDLGALGVDGRITAAGRAMRRLALPARLAHMVAEAPDTRLAAEIAVLLTERGLGGTDVDLEVRLSRFRSDRGARAQAARAMARRLAASAKEGRSEEAAPGTLLLLGYPDRVARARGGRGRFVLANGRGAMLDENEPLAAAPWLVVADLRGGGREARIAAAVAVTEDDVRAVLSDRIEETVDTTFDAGTGSLRSVSTARLGAITMRERQLPPPRGVAADAGIVEAVRSHGPSILPWDKAATALRQRLDWLRRGLGEPWPDIADEALAESLEDWLLPFLSGGPRLASITPAMLAQGLTALVPHHLQRQVDQLAPTHFRAPSGSHVPIRYDGEWPVLAIRVQELFGLDQHPSIAQGKVPLTLELLSPAHRPIQTTRDLPGFWRGSWAEVRAQMRGRYPRHPWPDDPLAEAATSRAKPRGK
jgi:ATP-dependent helicase HrpB